METTDTVNGSGGPQPRGEPEQQAMALFGLYKAEWLNGQLFDLFTKPEYFDDLCTSRPCVLIGGRGTGKTTVLRGISYEGQFALCGSDPAAVPQWPYYGVYHRVDTSKVTAFRGPELTEDRWGRCFAHYVNLLFCRLLADFVIWYGQTTRQEVLLSASALRTVCNSLHLPPVLTVAELAEALNDARVSFEASINNVADDPPQRLSMQAAPLDELAEALGGLAGFRGKHFFFLIDEYENLLDYQQRVLNTYIKHVKPSYTFKIGMRELGWRERATLNPNEQLVDPADYARVDIGERLSPDRFGEFASAVCNGRLGRISVPVRRSVEDLLPALNSDDEAILLGVDELNKKTLTVLEREGNASLLEFARGLRPTELFLIRFWAEAQGSDLVEMASDMRERPAVWKTRYGNYVHASLFAIHRGKRGIRKYYAGWETFALIANGNIRYLLQLVHRSLERHFDSGGLLSQEIEPEDQTRGAHSVGQKNLVELQGIDIAGAQLTKLLLSLGRVFGLMAATPEGHTPEVNQFYLADDDDQADTAAAERLLELGVMHLALSRSPGTKLIDATATREYDYMIHSIFAPFFEFSHRRKRKLRLTGSQLLRLVTDHRSAIGELLARQGRDDEVLAGSGATMPDQLSLFEGYYNGDQR